MIRILPAVLLAAAACGGSQKPAEPPAPTVWKDMNADQRHAYMEKVVMPKAKEVFMAFDAQRYADMDCKTCHGPGADDGSYELPNAAMRPLPNTPEAFMELIGKDADVQRFTPFMVEQVEPMMGELLQVTVFDPETKTGELSCATCHQLVDAAGNVVPEPRDDHAEHEHHHD